jgi:hypothetical protein
MQAAGDVLDDDGEGSEDSISSFDDDEYYAHIATLADDEERDNLERGIDNDNENDFLDRMNLPHNNNNNNNNRRNNGPGGRAVVDEADAVMDESLSSPSSLATIILVLLEVDETTITKPMEPFYDANNKILREAHVDEDIHCFLHYMVKRYYFPKDVQDFPAADAVDRTGDANAVTQAGRERCSKDTKEEEQEEPPLSVAGGLASHNLKPINSTNVNDSEEEEEEGPSTEAQPQPQNDANTHTTGHTTHSHNYLVHGAFDSFECLDTYMRRKYCADAFEFMLREYCSSMPMFSMWHRCTIVDDSHSPPRREKEKETAEYNKANHKGGMGFFFVKRVHYLSEDHTCPRMTILDALCHMASLAMYGISQEEENGGNKGCDNHLETETTVPAVLSGGGGCVSYDVLVSNDVVDRFDEVIEWSSWTSKEHYVCHMMDHHALLLGSTGACAAKVVREECDALINSYNHRPSVISYWERVPEIPFLT